MLKQKGADMDFLRNNQLDIMMYMSGVCGVLAIMSLMPRFMSRRRRSILAMMEIASMFLLIFDRLAYIYRGDASDFGGFMVRFTNGMTYFFTLLIPLLVTHFMWDLYLNEGGLKKRPKRFIICQILFLIGTILIIITQFTGLYYSFDEQNRYVRSPYNFISYIVPFLTIFIQESIIIQYADRLKKGLVVGLALSIALPTFASIIQFLFYGISLTSITMTAVVIVFFVYALYSLGDEVGKARMRELEFYKKAQEREAALFEETTQALANAIDAKDKYTSGHSTRVAELSRRIAKEAGFTDHESDRVYFAALLHDVGKIGVIDDIISKPGKLTDEEFENIKLHPVLGYQILSSIKQSPYLSDGAHYHHEHYDGSGYPDGLKGEEIPVIARIIAVADAYDAMTSSRSYRGALSKEEVRSEILNGMGKQFDTKFAAILLIMIDNGTVDQ
ncbi:MAG: HD-GYP domain-containing protein [Erysipelotrichaceae bacterium]|nr:HD-GYP domain-containing protein [Erysipelotrichaceae bacterium]